MNLELLINLGIGTQTVRGRTARYASTFEARDYFSQLCCVVFGLPPATFKSRWREQTAKTLGHRKETRQPIRACMLIKMLDLLIVIYI